MLKIFKQYLFNGFFSLSSLRGKVGVGPVFVVGTGRSGTHFLCSCLNEFPTLDDFFCGRESPYMFHEISNLTVNQKIIPPYVIGYYIYMAKKVYPKLFVDQTHPNIWNVEKLIEEFPRAKFLAISRDVRSVIYSMKMHEGVSKWIEDYEQYPVPNSFLGISKNNIDIYRKDLTNLQRAVFRWCAHEQRIDYLRTEYSNSVIKICYEDLERNMPGVMDDVAIFLDVPKPKSFKQFNKSSLNKRDLLSNDELIQIDEAIKLFNECYSDENFINVK